MADYHNYVFDSQKREFVGRFEEMYRAEDREGFDSWHQEDMRSLSNQICLSLINRYNFHQILDIGCGKGVFAHLLKKANNRVVGLDLSETALRIARRKFPDIEFVQADLSQETFTELPFFQNRYDLAVLMEVLSYLPNWREVLGEMARISGYALVSLFIPENPIGFVKSFGDLLAAFQDHYELLEDIHCGCSRKTVLFGKRKPV